MRNDEKGLDIGYRESFARPSSLVVSFALLRLQTLGLTSTIVSICDNREAQGTYSQQTKYDELI